MDPYRDALADPAHSILVVGLGGQVVGLDAATGEVRWRNMLPSGGLGPVHLAFRHGVLVVSPDDPVLCRLDYRTGRTLWTRPTRGSGPGTILVEPDLIVVTKDGHIDAFDHGGGHLWHQAPRGNGFGPSALAFPGNAAEVGSQRPRSA